MFCWFLKNTEKRNLKRIKIPFIGQEGLGGNPGGEVFSALKGAGGRNRVSVSLQYKAEREVQGKVLGDGTTWVRDTTPQKNGIFWEFFPSVGPPPLLGTPVSKKKSVVYFEF